MTEINEDFYCSADAYSKGICDPDNGSQISLQMKCRYGRCPNHHRKFPTPEQFESEYGFKWPDDGAVYQLAHNLKEYRWLVASYKSAKDNIKIFSDMYSTIVCACTHFGKPPDSWRTE